MSVQPRRRRRRVVAASIVVALAGAVAWFEFSRPSEDVCDGERGPTALVAVDASTGAERWTRLVGSASGYEGTVEGGELHLRSGDHELVVSLESGELVSCLDTGPEVAVPVATGPPVDLPPEPEIHEGDGVQLEVRDAGDQHEQALSLLARGGERWAQVVPGFEVELAAGTVVVLDQSGGTGRLSPVGADTRLAAYSIDNGEQLWQVALPGTPTDALGVGELVIAPGLTSLFAVDADSGAVIWEVDHGNPAKNGRYPHAGEYSRLFATEDESTVVGVITATAPYRD